MLERSKGLIQQWGIKGVLNKMSPITLGIIAERLENFMSATARQNNELAAGQRDIRIDVNAKHQENRASIHDARNQIQESHDDLHNEIGDVKLEINTLKVKLAMYSAIGGIAAGIFTSVVTTLIHTYLGR